MITCSKCGNEITDGAEACPYCGFSVFEGQNVEVSTAQVAAEAQANDINDIFIWLMSGTMALLLGLTYLNVPDLSSLGVGSLILLFIILDYRGLVKSGIKIHPALIVLGALFYPIYVITRIVKTKRILPGVVYLVLFTAFTVFTLRGFFSNSSKEIIDYMNNDVTVLAQTETKMLNSLESVTGDNFSDDYSLYNEIKTTTLPTAELLASEADSIYNDLSSKEIKEVHSIYIDYCKTYCEALEYVLDGIEQQNKTTIAEAYDKFEQASGLGTDYKDEIDRLANKYGVKIR